ncbi:MAG: hypothetical protein ACOH2J_19605 [Allorhizobium sp.]
MTIFTTTKLLLASAALVTLSGPAWALDGQDLIAKINAAYMAGSGAIAAKTVQVNGDNVTLQGVTLTMTGTDAKSVDLGDINLEDVSEEDGGAYLVKRIAFPDVNFKQDKATISVKDLYLGGVHIPGDTTKNNLSAVMLYDEAHSGPVAVQIDGKEVFSMAGFKATTGISDDGATLSFDGNARGIQADLAMVDDPKGKEAVDALGLQKINGDISLTGSWETTSGTIDIEEYVFDFANIGRLSLSASLSGYTMDLVKQLQQTARSMQGNPNNQQAQQAAGIAMLGLAQQMSFISAEIAFEDDGITKRGLSYGGKQQGMSGEQMAGMIKGMAPLLLAQYKLGDLQNQISAAINTYMDDPKSLTISAEPENPVPFPMIMGASMGAPETVPGLLGVTVSAND